MATERHALVRVTLVYAPAPRQVRELAIEMPLVSTVGDAIRASGWLADFSPEEVAQLEVGVWGRKVELGQVLRDRDRVELYRALKVDPKVARRERFARQGAKTAGLFARRRPGAKAGY